MGFLDALNDALDEMDEILGDDEEFDPDFTLVNRSGYEIHEVYVSESDNDDWEEDILGEDILEDGERMNINFSTTSRKRYWDLKTVDEEGDEEVYERFDLSRIRKITVYYNEDGEAEAEYQY